MARLRIIVGGVVGTVLVVGLPATAQEAPAQAKEERRSSEDAVALLARAAVAYNSGDFAESARLYESAIEAGATTPRAPFNAACCYARLHDADAAFAWLERAFDAGWRDVTHLEADADLASLHDDLRWEHAVQRCQVQLDKFIKSLKEPALREELLRRLQDDQRIRLMPRPDMKEWQRIDADNAAFMKRVIEKHGWPGRSMVGPDGAQAAFFLVQHAASDLAFQKRCLELLTKAVEQKEAAAADMVYLLDRVLVAEGKPQRYGTQFQPVPLNAPNAELQLAPIEDEAHVDARRKEVGLQPLADYVRQMRDMQKRKQ